MKYSFEYKKIWSCCVCPLCYESDTGDMSCSIGDCEIEMNWIKIPEGCPLKCEEEIND